MAELMAVAGFFWGSLVIGVTIGIVFGLPMIWYHVGHISRKMDKQNKLINNTYTILDEIARVLEDIRDILNYKK